MLRACIIPYRIQSFVKFSLLLYLCADTFIYNLFIISANLEYKLLAPFSVFAIILYYVSVIC